VASWQVATKLSGDGADAPDSPALRCDRPGLAPSDGGGRRRTGSRWASKKPAPFRRRAVRRVVQLL